jgi:hypothetical protein
VGVEVVHHGVDPLDRRVDPSLDFAEEIHPVRGGAAAIGGGERVPMAG